MTLIQAYQEALTKLHNPNLDEINIRILLCENNHLKTMSDFYLHKDENVRDLQRFNRELQRFLSGEPIQYITENASFYGLDFFVNPDVLIPRNETEEVVDFAIKEIKNTFGDAPINIADVCCGSGCIGISIAKNAIVKKVFFSDISKDAIRIANKNANLHAVSGEFIESDSLSYLDDFPIIPDVVVSNPPYILKKEDVQPSVLEFEPQLALFADQNLSIYRKIIEKSVKYQIKLIVFEIGYDLEEKLSEICKELAKDYLVTFKKDMNGLLRILSIKRK